MEVTERQKVSGNLLVTLYFTSKIFPMLVSGLAIYLGYKLFVLGVTGDASIVVDAKSIRGQLVNAAPGLFFAFGGVVGLVVSIWKGSSFTFAASDPGKDYEMAMCIPYYTTKFSKKTGQRHAKE